MITNKLKVSTPGRICLFGEHQDYLQLPIIAAAISLRISVEGERRHDMEINIDLPDIGEKESFSLTGELKYTKERDYFRSAVNVLRRKGYTFSSGFDCKVGGTIPINAGTSSSSALIITWTNFLLRMSDQAAELSAEDIACYAHEAEVLEFSEPGGMMDHYSTSVGNVIYMEMFPKVKVEKVKTGLKTFVLGNSMEPKDTKDILARVKNQVIQIVETLRIKYPDFSLQTIRQENLHQYTRGLNAEQAELLAGTVQNRDITQKARKYLTAFPSDFKCIGQLLNEHQSVLRDVLRISTPKIDRMLQAAIDAGACGGKINGSGGGGCMFAYAPDDPEKVKNAIEKAGGKAYIIEIGKGTRTEEALEKRV